MIRWWWYGVSQQICQSCPPPKHTDIDIRLATYIPLYSWGAILSPLKIMIVGKSLTRYWSPSALYWCTSTLPTLTTPCGKGRVRGWGRGVGQWGGSVAMQCNQTPLFHSVEVQYCQEHNDFVTTSVQVLVDVCARAHVCACMCVCMHVTDMYL